MEPPTRLPALQAQAERAPEGKGYRGAQHPRFRWQAARGGKEHGQGAPGDNAAPGRRRGRRGRSRRRKPSAQDGSGGGGGRRPSSSSSAERGEPPAEPPQQEAVGAVRCGRWRRVERSRSRRPRPHRVHAALQAAVDGAVYNGYALLEGAPRGSTPQHSDSSSDDAADESASSGHPSNAQCGLWRGRRRRRRRRRQRQRSRRRGGPQDDVGADEGDEGGEDEPSGAPEPSAVTPPPHETAVQHPTANATRRRLGRRGPPQATSSGVPPPADPGDGCGSPAGSRTAVMTPRRSQGYQGEAGAAPSHPRQAPLSYREAVAGPERRRPAAASAPPPPSPGPVQQREWPRVGEAPPVPSCGARAEPGPSGPPANAPATAPGRKQRRGRSRARWTPLREALPDPAAPEEYLCPICSEVMTRPHQCRDGHNLCLGCWEQCLARPGGRQVCPMDNVTPVRREELVPNRFLQDVIEKYLEEKNKQ